MELWKREYKQAYKSLKAQCMKTVACPSMKNKLWKIKYANKLWHVSAYTLEEEMATHSSIIAWEIP